ncbi:FMN-dependent oxidoreductase (nitrilotriacetate monooxygenase family) [Paraburkholderia unamae]|uniref:NtaA/DmoA family FMN-dependent monooxygenase n=1 Tax=Paraburkholderia unamae TaxID=219649 RepID=UPI000DC4CCB1|nr:NtaA/DmoA family FMN-dependent monooxygenase [Paraburkholderia unamae]RAR54935.1 FMN-dependent oxidoreductase (nitrilotriacetate monooxygenase family) [Paraburkholderia unamae]
MNAPEHRTARKLILNAFEMNAVGHLSHGLWAHPDDQALRYTDIDYWLDLARTLEDGLFDGLFLADALGVYDVYGGGPRTALTHAVQTPVNDPIPIVAAMAAATRHLAFGVTAQTGLEPPYLFARRFSTLDHLSKGRIGWNIVTGFLDSAARASGAQSAGQHDARYDHADDYVSGLYRLWEDSWADDAVLRDRATGRFADASRIRAIRHEGPHYPFEAIHLSEPSPQRTPVLYQAGASPRGLAFATRHAECLFLPNNGVEATASKVRRIETLLAEHGRSRRDVRLLSSVVVIVAPTRNEAQARYASYRRYAQPLAALAQLASATGIDFSRYAPDEPIVAQAGNAIQSAVAGLSRAGEPVTVTGLLERMPLGGKFDPVVGSAAEVADALIAYADATGIDGFNLVRTVTPQCFRDIASLLVPELQTRGRFKTAYEPGTYREKLFGRGRNRLPHHHPGRTAPQHAAFPTSTPDIP